MTLPLNLSSLAFFVPSDTPQPTVTTIGIFVLITLVFAVFQAGFFAINVLFFQRPGQRWNKRVLPPLSVLIPARNEELSIVATIDAVLASRGVDLELIVLDDGSTDATAELVRAAAEVDPRVRLETAPELPDGWNGKQHACWELAALADTDVFCFLDADVRVGPEALYRMLSELNYAKTDQPELALVSGFPRQETVTVLEWFLLPLIHFVLLCFLPLPAERWLGSSAFAAGCGQFLMVRREPYFESGGHSAIRQTMHDGLLLPKLFRDCGFRTRVYDLSQDAVCRMYRSAGEVWRGLTKNATEGMATILRLPVFTVLLLVGQLGAIGTLIWAYQIRDWIAFGFSMFVLCIGYGIRAFSAWRYGQSWYGVLVHPLGIVVLLVLQWCALLGKLVGVRATWKQRTYRVQ